MVYIICLNLVSCHNLCVRTPSLFCQRGWCYYVASVAAYKFAIHCLQNSCQNDQCTCKFFLPDLIHGSQTGFDQDWHILDNRLTFFEVVEWPRLGTTQWQLPSGVSGGVCHDCIALWEDGMSGQVNWIRGVPVERRTRESFSGKQKNHKATMPNYVKNLQTNFTVLRCEHDDRIISYDGRVAQKWFE